MADLPATVRLRRLGANLRRLREASGLTLEEASLRMERSLSSLSKIENGRVRVAPRDLRVVLDAYEVKDDQLREALLKLARDARKRGWWQQYGEVVSPSAQDFISLEADAYGIRTYETILIPGLLQTSEYTRVVCSAVPGNASQERIEKLLAARATRQEILVRPDPVNLWAIIGEAALRQEIGGAPVMKGQLHKLLEVAELPNVTTQVLPFSTPAHAGLDGPFTVLEFPDLSDWDVVSVGNLAGTLYLEDEADIRRFNVVFDRLRASALPESDSKKLIERRAAEL